MIGKSADARRRPELGYDQEEIAEQQFREDR
jgi:hypothetical protein